jgi:hypothetical protein
MWGHSGPTARGFRFKLQQLGLILDDLHVDATFFLTKRGTIEMHGRCGPEHRAWSSVCPSHGEEFKPHEQSNESE